VKNRAQQWQAEQGQEPNQAMAAGKNESLKHPNPEKGAQKGKAGEHWKNEKENEDGHGNVV